MKPSPNSFGKNMKKAKQIQKTLSQGYRLPKAIVEISNYLDANGYPISGCFELSDIGMEDLKCWFPGKPEIHEQFLPFGRGACGDVYAVWLNDSKNPETSPVVMFGSEGELHALAVNPEEFCRLLCIGYSEIGLEPFDSPPDDNAETEPFRNFMVGLYGFTIPETAAPIVYAVEFQSKEFRDFVSENQS